MQGENPQRREKLEQLGDEVPLLQREKLGTIVTEEERVEFRPTSALPLSSVASEDQHGSPEDSHGESALLRLAELADEFDAEQVAADARSVAERVSRDASTLPVSVSSSAANPLS